MQPHASGKTAGQQADAVSPVAIPHLSSRLSRGMRLAFVEQSTAMVFDILSAGLAMWLAYLIRYRLEIGGDIPIWAEEPFWTFAESALVAMVLTPIIFAFRGTYRLDRTIAAFDSTVGVIGGFTTVMAGVVMLAFFLRFAPSRLVFLYAWLIGMAVMFGHRRMLMACRRMLWKAGIGVDRVLIVGEGESARRVMQALFSEPHLGYRLVGFASTPGGSDRMNVATEQGTIVCPRLGTADQISELVRRHRVDEVIIAPDDSGDTATEMVLMRCREQVVKFRLVPNVVQFSQDRVALGEIAGIPLIGIRDGSIRGWNALTKRLIDIMISLVVLALTALPMAAIALWIKCDSDGPIFYRQVRVGQNGRNFTMLKFRCMVKNADQLRTELLDSMPGADIRLFKLPDDPRLTRVGRALRRYSLDELPQFVQVLRGEMSLIGPRPPMPVEVQQYDEWHLQRLLVKPGLTGLWQVNGRSKLSFDEMVRLDLYYAENWSPWLDTRILMRTIPAVLAGRGAY